MMPVARVAVVLALGGAAALSLFNSFFLPLTPDISIYLLHARSFLETFQRYTVSHDSKGPLLTLLLAPAVSLLGPTQAAAALTQTISYLVAAALLIHVMTRAVGPWTAAALALLWLVAAFSPFIWGGRMRPEDLGVAYSMVALFSLLELKRPGLILAGVMAGCAAFTKTTLAIGPLFMILAAVALRARTAVRENRAAPAGGFMTAGRQVMVEGVLAAAGFLAVAAILLGWIAISDSLAGWHRQTLAWPMTYKQQWHGNKSLGQAALETLDLLRKGGLSWLFCGALFGLFRGWRRGRRHLVLLLAAMLAGEFYRVSVEKATWRYLVGPMVLPLLGACGLLGISTRTGRESTWGWAVSLVLLWGVVGSTMLRQFSVFHLRVLNDYPTPYEALAEALRPHYRAGETMIPTGNDYEILLHLGAPRPYPVMPYHMASALDVDKKAAMEFYRQHPPDWIIDKDPRWSPIPFQIVGNVDDLIFCYVPEPDWPTLTNRAVVFHVGDRYRLPHPSPYYQYTLMTNRPYRLVVDIGCMQAWRREGEGVGEQ